MFTGIITDVGRIAAVEARGDLRLRIACGYDMETVDLGASIACSGVCLTVVDKGPDWFAVDVSAETAGRTARDMWGEGRRLNLERSLRLGDELGGHIVTGHVDGVGTVAAVEPVGDSRRLTIEAPAGLARYIAGKGSIAVDGVSLTVNAVDGARFEVNIIPHTAEQTTLGDLAAGSGVNLEIDVLARYLGRMLEARG
ncbi:MAG: riboflavin synthase [Sphingomonadales bacterium]|jgi:riboflavin synthase|nr:riboflavin synthase [Sphingomonadales bacterium]MEA3049143.1 riboflavin synthase [Sphingomonadales bacterium]